MQVRIFVLIVCRIWSVLISIIIDTLVSVFRMHYSRHHEYKNPYYQYTCYHHRITTTLQIPQPSSHYTHPTHPTIFTPCSINPSSSHQWPLK